MRWLPRLCVLFLLALALALLLPGFAMAAPVPVTVTITSVECTQEDECDAAGIEAAGQSTPDFYAKIFINGAETRTVRAPDDNLKVEPFGWTATATVDDSVPPAPLIPVTIQIWDHDSTSGDDLGDASPQSDHNNLDLLVNLTTGRWSGDTTTSCATGDGVDTDDDEYYPMKVCFDISVRSPSGDLDGDGLLDSWEQFGFDADGDGTIDADLPAWGANPRRQDIFVELDYELGRPPTRDGINALKRAFAAAPRPNPDGSSGITLHVDVGLLIDPTADEAGRTGTCSNGLDDDGDGSIDGLDSSCFYLDGNREVGVGDCGNGLDDDGDGLADDKDPNCRVGDNLGKGSFLTPVGACGLDTVFATAQQSQFDEKRRWVFHYGIQAAAPTAPAGSPPLNCQGGEGEIGGNDFISHNLGPGSLMHELGHNLNLDHGGSNAANCKPNYVSVMNYNLQVGIPRVGGGFILDYSPPRQALNGSTRSSAPLGPLVENALNENSEIDLADGQNQSIFMNGTNNLVTVPMNAKPNYNNDPADPPFDSPLTVNIDNGIAATATTPSVGAPGCANMVANSTLNGDNDWNRVALAFRQFAASAAGTIVRNPEEASPTDEEMREIVKAIHTTNLVAGLAANPDPVASGTILTYVATATNAGPNPAAATRLSVTLPIETTRTGILPTQCTEPTPGTVSCDLGTMLAGASRSFTLQAAVPADLVYKAGAPLPITATASVENQAGTESNPPDNAVSVAVMAVAVADLSMVSLEVDNPPVQMLTGENVVINLSSAITSAGPSSPMDTLLTLTATADTGASVSPTWLTTSQVALEFGEQRELDDHAIISCRTRGKHVYNFAHRLDPARTPDTDPDPSNNEARASLTVECRGSDAVVVYAKGPP